MDGGRSISFGAAEAEDFEEAAAIDREYPGPRPRPTGLAVYNIGAHAYTRSVDLGYPPGTMMPAGPEHVVTFFRRPRIVSLTSGKVVHEWTYIDSGEAVSSIMHSLP